MSEIIYLPIVCIVSMIVVSFITPKIIKITRKGNLCDEPNSRKLNKTSVPTLGGIGIYLGIIIATLVFTHGMEFNGLKYIFLAITILLCIGIFDDIFTVSAYVKLAYQICISLLLIGFAGIRVTSLHGLLGIYELNLVMSYVLSTIIFLGLINAINLIDGIDGLASGIGILATVILGLLESYVGNREFAILAFSTMGALFAFIFFNVFARRNKIFMGDTGSTILGAIIAILVIDICEMNVLNHQGFFIVSPVSFVLSVLIIPVFDTIRVMSIRIYKRKSPFSADKSHMHHWLLKFGFNHLYVTLILVVLTFMMVGVNLLLQGINDNLLLAITVVLGMIITGFPALFVKRIQRMDCILLRRITIYIWRRTYGSRRFIHNIGSVIDKIKSIII